MGLCVSCRNGLCLINGGMFDIQKWGCVSCRNGCLGLINGGIQKWGYVSVAEMGV